MVSQIVLQAARKLLFKLAKSAANAALNYLYNYIDKNDDGKLDKNELDEFVGDLRKKLNKIKRKV